MYNGRETCIGAITKAPISGATAFLFPNNGKFSIQNHFAVSSSLLYWQMALYFSIFPHFFCFTVFGFITIFPSTFKYPLFSDNDSRCVWLLSTDIHTLGGFLYLKIFPLGLRFAVTNSLANVSMRSIYLFLCSYFFSCKHTGPSVFCHGVRKRWRSHVPDSTVR